MSDEAVQAEVKAVRDLRNAVTRYAEQMRETMAAARHDAAALVKRTEANLQQRKSRLERAMRELQQAQAALAACRDPKQSATLHRAVVVAKAHADETRQLHAYAQKAARIAAAAQSDLLKTMQALEAVVGEHSSVSSLEGRLAEIDIRGSVGTGISRTITAIGVAAEIWMAAANFGRVVGDVSQGRLPTADRLTSISEMRQEQERQEQETYAVADAKWQEDHSGEVPGHDIPGNAAQGRNRAGGTRPCPGGRDRLD
jgi:hypothetical protein